MFSKHSLRNHTKVSYCLAPDQVEQIRPERMSDLIWLQTVYKGYQQIKLTCIELKISERNKKRKCNLHQINCEIFNEFVSCFMQVKKGFG